jgi:hypothetical protein
MGHVAAAAVGTDCLGIRRGFIEIARSDVLSDHRRNSSASSAWLSCLLNFMLSSFFYPVGENPNFLVKERNCSLVPCRSQSNGRLVFIRSFNEGRQGEFADGETIVSTLFAVQCLRVKLNLNRSGTRFPRGKLVNNSRRWRSIAPWKKCF